MAVETAPIVEQKESKGARTRALIKDTMVKMVSERNPQYVTLQDICDATNLTVGAFYFHFRNKDAALEEAATDAVQTYFRTLDCLPANGSLTERLEPLMRAFIANYTTHEANTRLISMMLPNSVGLKHIWQEERRKLADKLEELVVDARQKGGIDKPFAFFTVEFLMTATEAFLENLFFGTDDRLKVAVGAPELIIKNITAIWERAILNDNEIGDYL